MSNRFHSKYHRKNHHTYGNASNPEASHDPIASPDQPFLGDFSLQGALCAVAPLSAYAGYFYSSKTGIRTIGGEIGIAAYSLNTPLSTAFGKNIMHGTVGINKNTITSGYVLDVLGNTNLDGNLNVVGDVDIDGGDLTASTPSFNLVNTNATTVKFAGAATTIEIAASTGTTTINNNLVVDLSAKISGTTESTAITNGALVVDGGVGIAKNLNVGGTIKFSGTTDSTSCTDGTLVIAGGVGIGKNLNICGKQEINNTTESTSYSTGALIVDGGVGIAKNLNVQGNAIITGDLTVNGTTTYINTEVQITSAIEIYNTGDGPALKITQTGSEAIAHFIDSNGDDIVFNDDGFVGIGYSTPTNKLSVNGSIYSSDKILFGTETDPDVNLYRKDTSTLKTDDNFEATKIYSINTAGNSDQWNSNYTSVSQNSATWNSVTDKMPLFTNIPVSQVGDLSYLGLDIKGDFKGPQSSNYEKPYILQEKDGSMVGIRPGYNGIYKKQFYIRASNIDLDDLIVTDIEYKPSFLLGVEYVSNLIDGNEYGICVTIRNTTNSTIKYYWINLNDTMDYSQHTFVDVTSIFSGFGMGFGSGSLVYCKEKNWYIASKFSGNAVFFNIYNSSFTVLGSQYQQIDLDSGVGVNYGTYEGNNISLVSINHTNRPTIDYYVDNTNNRLILTHNVALTLYYPTDLLGAYYRSACYFNTSTYSYSDVFPKNETGNTRYGIDTNNLGSITYPFYFTTNLSNRLTNFQESIKHRKFYKIDDNTILESIKDHAWEPTYFSFVKHTLNGNFTWGDFIVRPYDFIVPKTSFETRKVFYVNDASLLGKDIRYSYWVSPNDIVLWAQSKSAQETVPSRKWIKVHIDDYTDRTEKVDVIGDTLQTPSSVELSTFSLLNGMNLIHTTLNSSGTMRVKKLDGLIYKEINGETEIVTDDNVVTLPSNYETQILQILNTDTNKIGTLTTRSTDYDWRLYHLTNSTFLLVYGYYQNGTGVTSYFKIVTLSGSSLSALSNTGTLVGTFFNTYSYSSIIANQAIADNATCGIYDDGTYLHCIFKCVGPQGPGSNYLPTSVAKIQKSNNSIVLYKSSIYGSASWHTITASIHPYFGPCLMESHIDELTKNKIFFVDKTTISNLNTRITSCFSDIYTNTTPITNTPLFSLSLKSALGFNLYISDTSVFMKGSYYILPTQNINLNDLFPSNTVKNKTFYVYLELSTDVNTGQPIPILTFLTSFRQDGVALIYIGTIITDSNGIIYTNFEKITKINTPLKVGNNIHMDISGKVGINSEINENYTLTVGGTIKNDPTAPVTTTVNPYNVTQDDHDKTIVANHATTTININLPSGLKAGTQVSVIRKGAGTVQFAKGSGLPTILSTPTNAFVKLGFQNSAASAYWTGNEWYLVGDLLT